MNKKVLLIAVAVLAIALVVPLVPQLVQSDDVPAAVGANTPNSGRPQSRQRPAERVVEAKPAPPAEPLLDESSLAGTAWSVKTKDIPVPVTINLNAGGQAVATIPPALSALARQMLGTDIITGTWSVQGPKLIASVMLQGKEISIACDIVGDKLMYEGAEIQRVR